MPPDIWCKLSKRHDRRLDVEDIKRTGEDTLEITLRCAHDDFEEKRLFVLPSWKDPDPPPPPPPPIKPKVPPEEATFDFLKADCPDGGFNFTGHIPMLAWKQQKERFAIHEERGYNSLLYAAANSAGKDNTSSWPRYDFFEDPESFIPHLELARKSGFSIILFLQTDSCARIKAMSREERWEHFKRGLDLWEPYLSSVCPSIESDEWDNKEDLQWMINKLAARYPNLPRGVHFLPTMTEVGKPHYGWGWEWFSHMKNVDILYHQQVDWKRYPKEPWKDFRRRPSNVGHNVAIIAERCQEMGIIFCGCENTPDKEPNEAFAWELAEASNKTLRRLGLPVLFGNGAHPRWIKK